MIVNLVIAAAAMALSSVSVVANSLRLRHRAAGTLHHLPIGFIDYNKED